jgi:hypothetical protein
MTNHYTLSKPRRIDVIPAAPGTYAVYETNGLLSVHEAILAWRIESAKSLDGEITSRVYPISFEGVLDDDVSILNPNGTVSIYGGATYKPEADEWYE